MKFVLKLVVVGVLFNYLLFCISLVSAKDTDKFTRKIVVFNESVTEDRKEQIINRVKGVKLKQLYSLNTTVIQISEVDARNLVINNEIIRIDNDDVVSISGKAKPSPTPIPIQPEQTIPWGIQTIEAPALYQSSFPNSVKVGIIDTGIDMSHPDLKANIKGGVNTISAKINFNDDNGHGTHVAGVIGGINNNIGIVGVAPNINIYAIKALDNQGIGYVSDIIEGLNWCVNNGINIVNMSFNLNTDNKSLYSAISNANKCGLILVAAVGNNEGKIVSYPAAYSEVISVGAVDIYKNIASFSSTGKVDVVAPGVDIYSSYKGGTYSLLSGTSMAAPHVTGIAALLLATPEKCDINRNGIVSPEEVKNRLESTCIDLGGIGKDDIFGAGLVNALNAIKQ